MDNVSKLRSKNNALIHCFGTEASVPVTTNTVISMLQASMCYEIPVNTHTIDEVTKWQDLPLGYGEATWKKVSENFDISNHQPVWNINLAHSAEEAKNRTEMILSIGFPAPVKLEVLNTENKWSVNEEVISCTTQLYQKYPCIEVWPLIRPDIEDIELLSDLGCKMIRLMGSAIGSLDGLNESLIAVAKHVLKQKERPALMLDGGVGSASDVLEALDLGFDSVLVNSCLFNSDLSPVNLLQGVRKSVDEYFNHNQHSSNSEGL